MAKDAKGHGSEKRGDKMFGRQPTRSDRKQLLQITKAFSAFAGAVHSGDSVSGAHDKAAAAALAAPGNPKSVAAPVHPNAAGRSAQSIRAEHEAWQKFHKDRKIPGPHYLDPNDPRGRRK